MTDTSSTLTPEQIAEIKRRREERQGKVIDFNTQRNMVLETDTPDDAAYDLQKAEELGIPREAIGGAREEYKAEDTLRKMQQMRQAAPRASEWLAAPENYAVAKDDIESLSQLEASLKKVPPTKQQYDLSIYNELPAVTFAKNVFRDPKKTALDAAKQTGDAGRSFLSAAPMTVGSVSSGLGAWLDSAVEFTAKNVYGNIPIVNRGLKEAEDWERRFFARHPEVAKAITPYAGPGAILKTYGAEGKKVQAAWQPADMGFEDKVAQGLGQVVVQVGLALATGGTATGAGLSTGSFMAMGADQQAESLKAAGLNPDEYFGQLSAGAAITGSAEMMRLNSILKIMPPAMRDRVTKSVVSRIASQAFEEGAQEAIEGVLHNVVTMTYDPRATILGGVAEAGAVGGTVGGLFQGLVELLTPGRARGGTTLTLDKMMEELARQETEMAESPDEKALADTIARVGKMKLTGLSPAKAAEAIGKITEGTGVETVTVDLDGVVEALNQSGIDPVEALASLGVTEQEIGQRFERFGQIEVSTATLLTSPLMRDNAALVSPHLRTGSDTATPAQKEVLRETMKEEVKTYVETIQGLMEQGKTTAEKVTQVRESLKARILGAGMDTQGPQLEAKLDALTALLTTLPQRTGQDVLDFYAARAPKIQGVMEGEVMEGEDVLPSMVGTEGATSIVAKGEYSRGLGAFSVEIVPEQRADGSYVLTRKITDEDGEKQDYFSKDGSWQSGRPSAVVFDAGIGGITEGPEVFPDISSALQMGRDAGLPEGASIVSGRSADVLPQAQSAGYEGRDRGEAASWLRGVEKFGPEGMTTEARMARAKEMGFDTDEVFYHGTGDLTNFSVGFDPNMTGLGNDQLGSGFYFTNQAETASGYTTRRLPTGESKLGGEDAPGVLPVVLNIKNPIVLENGTDMLSQKVEITAEQAEAIIRQSPLLAEDVDNNPLGNWHDIWSEGVQDWMIGDVASSYEGNTILSIENDFFKGHAEAFRRAVRDVLGYDGVIQKFDNGEVHKVAWFPEQVRSVHAAFDPDQSDSADLLGQELSSAEIQTLDAETQEAITDPETDVLPLTDDMQVMELDEFLAFHGTLAKFDKFETDKIGAGEGAQAFGPGHYFTQSRGIADWYRKRMKTLSPGIRMGKEAFNKANPAHFAMSEYWRFRNKNLYHSVFGGYKPHTSDSVHWRAIEQAVWALEFEIKQIENPMTYPGGVIPDYATPDRPVIRDSKELVAFLKAGIEHLRSLDPESSKGIPRPSKRALRGGGNIYTVSVKLPAEQTIQYDKPFGQQPAAVQKAFREAAEAGHLGKAGAALTRFGDATRMDVLVAALKNMKSPAMDAMRANGIRGVRYLDGMSRGKKNRAGQSYNYVVFNDGDVKILDREGKLFQMMDQKRRGQYAPRTNIITLFEQADITTLMHEAAHWYLETLYSMSVEPDAHPFVVEQYEAIRKWGKVGPDFRMYDDMGRLTPEAIELHESFAETFEVYLQTGKAPSASLRSAFQAFKKWITQLWKRMYGGGQPERANLNPEIVAVMDRMLAVDEEIDAQVEGIIRSAEQQADELLKRGIITKRQRDTAIMNLEAARESAKEDLMARLMEAKMREDEAWWNTERARVRRDVLREFDKSPVGRALSWLGYGQWKGDVPSSEAPGDSEAEFFQRGEQISEAQAVASREFDEEADRIFEESEFRWDMLDEELDRIIGPLDAKLEYTGDADLVQIGEDAKEKFLNEGIEALDPDDENYDDDLAFLEEEADRVYQEAYDKAEAELEAEMERLQEERDQLADSESLRLEEEAIKQIEEYRTRAITELVDRFEEKYGAAALLKTKYEEYSGYDSRDRYVMNSEGQLLPIENFFEDGGETLGQSIRTAARMPMEEVAEWVDETVTINEQTTRSGEVRVQYAFPITEEEGAPPVVVGIRALRDGRAIVDLMLDGAMSDALPQIKDVNERSRIAVLLFSKAVLAMRHYGSEKNVRSFAFTATDNEADGAKVKSREELYRFLLSTVKVEGYTAYEVGAVMGSVSVNNAGEKTSNPVMDMTGFRLIQDGAEIEEFEKTGITRGEASRGSPDGEIVSYLTAKKLGPETRAARGGMDRRGSRAGAADTGSTLGQEVAPTFYSALGRFVSRSGTARAPAAQWKGMIQNAPGIKAEEVEWTGVMEWLDLQQGPVAREALAQFVEANGVRVEEVVRGGGSSVSDDAQRQMLPLIERRDELQRELESEYYIGVGPDSMEDAERNAMFALEREVDDLTSQIDNLQRTIDLGLDDAFNDTKWSSFTLPGGSNYREILLTLPVKDPKRTSGYITVRDDDQADDILTDMAAGGLEDLDYGRTETNTGTVIEIDGFDDGTWEEVTRIAEANGARLRRVETTGTQPAFRSSHWSEPNVLAHVRFKERTGPNGERVLALEEVQSDWHQAGRERGYNDTESKVRRQQQIDEAKQRGDAAADMAREASERNKALWDQLRVGGMATQQDLPNAEPMDIARENQRRFRQGLINLGMQPATYGWLGADDVQNVMREFSDRIDKVAKSDSITLELMFPGLSDYSLLQSIIAAQLDFMSAVASREAAYARMRSLEGIEGVPNAPFKNNAWTELVLKRMIRYAAENGFDAVAWIPGNVQNGRIVEDTGDNRGDFYDKIVPNLANKLGKKYGAKVEKKTFDIPEFAFGLGLHTFPITPELAAAAMTEGFPLFQPGDPKGWGETAPPPDLPPMRLDLARTEEIYGKAAVDALPKAIKDRYRDQTSADTMLAAARGAAKTLKRKPPKSLFQFIRARKSRAVEGKSVPQKQWGIKGATDELKAMDRADLVNEASGIHIDYMRELAEGAGYLPEGSTVNDLLNAIDREARGEPVYSEQDANEVLEIQSAQQWADWLSENGVDIFETDQRKLKAAIAKVTRTTNADLKSPDEAAELLGFENGEQLLKALAEAGSREKYIDAETDRRMREEFGDPFASGEFAEAARQAAEAEVKFRAAEIEIEALARALGETAASKLAKEMAMDALSVMTVKELAGWERFLEIERREMRNAMKAVQAGDISKALTHKRRQLVNGHLAKAAREKSEAIEKTRKDLLTYFTSKGRRDKISRDYLDKIEALLETYELRVSKQGPGVQRKALSAKEYVDQMVADGREAEIAPEAMLLAAQADKKVWRGLTVDEVEYLAGTVRNLSHLGRTKNSLMKAQDKRRFDAVVAELVDALVTAGPLKGSQREYSFRKTAGEKITSGLRTSHAWLMRMEHQFRALDGKANGPIWNALFRIFADAADVESKMMAETAREVREAYEIYTPLERYRMHNVSISLPELPSKVGKRWTKMEVISMAMNWGVEYNRQALLEGYGWTADQVEAVFARLMTDKDWDFVERVWQVSGKYKAEAFALEKQMTGVEPKSVEGIEFTTASGRKIKGRYFHLEYDGRQLGQRSRRQAQQDAKEALSDRMKSFTKPMTKNGGLINRVGSGGKPVKLHISVFDKAVADTIHDIAYRRAVIDASRIINDPRFADAYEVAAGKEAYEQLMPWIEAIVKPPSDQATGGLAALVAVRRNLPVAYMGYKVGTALIQATGLLAGVPEVGLRWVAQGFAKATVGSPLSLISAYQAVAEKSEMMRDRPLGYDRDVREITTAMGASTPLGAIKRNAFILISGMDLFVSVPVWIGAYDKAMAGKVKGVDAGNEEDAIAYADGVIRRTQTSGRPQDLARVSRDNELWKQVSMLYGYFSNLYGYTSQQVRALRSGETTPPQFLFYMTVMFVAIPILTELLAGRLLPGDDEDDDETIEEKMGKAVVSNFAGMFPVVRDVVNYQLEPQYGYKLSPVASGMQDVAMTVNAPLDGEMTEGEYRRAVRAMGAIFGLPSSQLVITGDYLADLLSGTEAPLEDPADAAREALVRDTR